MNINQVLESALPFSINYGVFNDVEIYIRDTVFCELYDGSRDSFPVENLSMISLQDGVLFLTDEDGIWYGFKLHICVH